MRGPTGKPSVVLECSRSAGGLGIDVAMQGVPVVHASSMATILELMNRLQAAGIDVLMVRRAPSSREPSASEVPCPQPSEARAGADSLPVGSLAFGLEPGELAATS